MSSDKETVAPAAVRYEVSSPLRHGYPGIGVAGYYWRTDPSTIVELVDSDHDGPHEGNLRRLGRKTWARILAAAEAKRLIVQAPRGVQAAADAQMIARLSAEGARAAERIAELEGLLSREQAQIEPLRTQALADASMVASLREEAEKARKEASAATDRAEKATRAQAQSEQKVAQLETELAALRESQSPTPRGRTR